MTVERVQELFDLNHALYFLVISSPTKHHKVKLSKFFLTLKCECAATSKTGLRETVWKWNWKRFHQLRIFVAAGSFTAEIKSAFFNTKRGAVEIWMKYERLSVDSIVYDRLFPPFPSNGNAGSGENI